MINEIVFINCKIFLIFKYLKVFLIIVIFLNLWVLVILMFVCLDGLIILMVLIDDVFNRFGNEIVVKFL